MIDGVIEVDLRIVHVLFELSVFNCIRCAGIEALLEPFVGSGGFLTLFESERYVSRMYVARYLLWSHFIDDVSR